MRNAMVEPGLLAAISAVSAASVAPAAVGLRQFFKRRTIVPLGRDELETHAVFTAAVASALAAFCFARGAATLLHDSPSATVPPLLAFAAPFVLGAAPWLAGEILSGHSPRSGLSLAASTAAAFAVSLASFALCFARPPAGDGVALIQFAAATAAALCAGRAYLATRGEPTPAR
jgi:hypothetical protein